VKGAFFALSVADLDASANWYAEKCGLQAPKTKTLKSAVIVLVYNLAGRGLLVELIQSDEAMPLSKALPELRSYPPIRFRSSLACCSASFMACLVLTSGFS
jgi:hypothetical protein